MSLDISKLENVKTKSGKIIARCPACFENGHDRKGEHLFIAEDSKFGCVVYPDSQGVQHRKRIFALVGKHQKKKYKKKIEHIPVKKFDYSSQNKIICKDILGRMGRVISISSEKIKKINNNNENNLKIGVPAVPRVIKTVNILKEHIPLPRTNKNQTKITVKDGITYLEKEWNIIKNFSSKELEIIKSFKQVFPYPNSEIIKEN